MSERRSVLFLIDVEPDARKTRDSPGGWEGSDAAIEHVEPATTSADTSLWMLPLTTTLPSWRLVRRPPYLMKASRSPNLALSSSHVWPHIRNQLEEGSDVPLSIVLRSGDLTNRTFLKNFLRTTGELARHRLTASLRGSPFLSPSAHWRTSALPPSRPSKRVVEQMCAGQM